MTLPTENPLRAIAAQAVDWYLLHRDGELTTAQKAQFLEWLRASPQHTGEYIAVARLWGSCKDMIPSLRWDEIALFEQMQAQEGNVVSFASTRAVPKERDGSERSLVFKKKSVLITALAASLAMTGIAIYWLTPVGFAGLPRAVSVARGEQRTLHLYDGSVLHVNANSRVKVRFSRQERLIELDRGQALFEVAPDPARPFRVRAGVAEAVAVGTQFDVYRHDSDKVTVTVVQGRVDVVDHRTINQTEPSAVPLQLRAGEQVQLGDALPKPQPQHVDLRVATAWMRREVIFEGQRLDEVTEEFNRYIAVPIEIDDPTLQQLEVSGVFNAYDADSFLSFLRQYDVEIERGQKIIHVRRTLSSNIHEKMVPQR